MKQIRFQESSLVFLRFDWWVCIVYYDDNSCWVTQRCWVYVLRRGASNYLALWHTSDFDPWRIFSFITWKRNGEEETFSVYYMKNKVSKFLKVNKWVYPFIRHLRVHVHCLLNSKRAWRSCYIITYLRITEKEKNVLRKFLDWECLSCTFISG